MVRWQLGCEIESLCDSAGGKTTGIVPRYHFWLVASVYKRRKCSISEDGEDEDCILSPVKAVDLWVLFPLESAAGLCSLNGKTAGGVQNFLRNRFRFLPGREAVQDTLEIQLALQGTL